MRKTYIELLNNFLPHAVEEKSDANSRLQGKVIH